MKDRMISVEHVSKEYRLGVIGQGMMGERTANLREKLRSRKQSIQELSGNASDRRNHGERKFMALSDVSFEVNTGEALGIIGSNGAGKSTLLKLLTKITQPSEGHIFLNGHVASMIEVGTGFHPELTGRENIYLNGAMLGMSMREIDRKLGEIIEFSECGQFIDTPVKRYSSGMYLKLGFSVAAHLDAEIVTLDEVLAVGDAAFQNKCIHKIREISESGKTILFVSHNMNLIRRLCSRCIVLDQGSVKFNGDVESAIQNYISASFYMERTRNLEHMERPSFHRPNRMACMTYIELLGCTSFEMGEKLHFLLRFQLLQKTRQLYLRAGLWSVDGTAVAISFIGLPTACEGKNEMRFCVDTSRLLPGKYSLELLIVDMDETGQMVKMDGIRDVIAFEILPSGTWPVYQPHNPNIRDWGFVQLLMSLE